MAAPLPLLSGMVAAAAAVAVPPPTPEALAYYRITNLAWVAATLWAIAVPATLAWTGWSARIARHLRTGTRFWVIDLCLFLAAYEVIRFALDVPFDYLARFRVEHAFGLSRATLDKWLWDGTKGLLVGIVTGCVVAWIPFLILRRSPRRWWVYTGLLTIPLMLLNLLVQPLWIDPLFNRFGPMRDAAMEQRIIGLAERAGIEGSRVFEVDKSRDTRKVNAYVTGLASSHRIVLWDTLLDRLEPAEVLFIMGHEMGHYVLGHVWQKTICAALLSVLLLGGVHLAAMALLARWHDRFGFDRLSDPAALPLLVALATAGSVAILPFFNILSRYQEHEADRFGLEITRSNEACARAFVRLQTENLSNPYPGRIVSLWRGTHPSLGERVSFCNSYRPWETGESLRYGNLFHR